jgi:hypothetical protein
MVPAGTSNWCLPPKEPMLVNDDASQPQDAAPTGRTAADSAPPDQPGPAQSPGGGDRSGQARLTIASLGHLAEVAEASRRIAARPLAIRVAGGGSTLGLLAPASGGRNQWAGAMVAQRAAKLHRDVAGISKRCERFAQVAASAAGWRVGLGLSDHVARAVVGAAGWRMGPGLDLKVGAKFARPLTIKVSGGGTLGLLAPAGKGHQQWAGLLATGRTAKLHSDLAGISGFSGRFAQAAAGWQVPLALDREVGARFARPLAIKLAGGNTPGLLAPAGKGHHRWVGAIAAGRAAKLQGDLGGISGFSERLAQAVIAHPRPVEIGLASAVDTVGMIDPLGWETKRRAAADQANTAVPALVTLMEGQAQVLVGISEAIEELRVLARSSQASQQAEAAFHRRLQLAVLVATLAALLLSALGYFAPREAAPVPVSPAPAPATSLTAPHAGAPTSSAPGAGGGRGRNADRP